MKNGIKSLLIVSVLSTSLLVGCRSNEVSEMELPSTKTDETVENELLDIRTTDDILDRCYNESYEVLTTTSIYPDDYWYGKGSAKGCYESPALVIRMNSQYTFDEWKKKTSDKDNGLDEINKAYNEAKEICETIRNLDDDYEVIEIIVECYSKCDYNAEDHVKPLFDIYSSGLTKDGTVDEDKKPYISIWGEAQPDLRTVEYSNWLVEHDLYYKNR